MADLKRRKNQSRYIINSFKRIATLTQRLPIKTCQGPLKMIISFLGEMVSSTFFLVGMLSITFFLRFLVFLKKLMIGKLYC